MQKFLEAQIDKIDKGQKLTKISSHL